jgi:hypothetical protein
MGYGGYMQVTDEFISMGELAVLSMEMPREILKYSELLRAEDIASYVAEYFDVPVDRVVSWSV